MATSCPGGEDDVRLTPLQTAIHVSKDSVVAPPPRFLSISDEALLSFFQDALVREGADTAAAVDHADQLAALFSLMEGVIQHEFLGLRRRLEADFAVFSAACQGVQLPGTGQHPSPRSGGGAKGGVPAKRFQRMSSIEEHERRFLRDFMSAMHSSHYRLLGLSEWEAAQAEAFLFTLPVEVEWNALDKRMLQRFWGDRPEQRATLPELSDRILIFCRGFEPAKMRGRYLMVKIELLLSFYLLGPLWAALTRVLEMLGLRAPPLPLMACTPKKQDVTFKCASTAVAAAVRWRRAAQGDGGGDGAFSQLHDACTVIERKTMSRHFPTGRSVLSRFFDVIELQEACLRDVVVLFRRKVPKEARQPGEKEVVRGEGGDPAALARNIQIRQFAGIPLADLEMVMPEKKVFVPGSVMVQLMVAAIAAVAGLLATFWRASLDWAVWGSALMLLASRASQVYFQASSERNEIEREMNKLLFERTVASQEAVLHTLTDEMCKQHIRECFLCYCCLLLAGKDMPEDRLDVLCERLLRTSFGLRLDFTAEAAVPALCEWGLVHRLPSGKLRAEPLHAALVALDSVWDGAFNFDAPSERGHPTRLRRGPMRHASFARNPSLSRQSSLCHHRGSPGQHVPPAGSEAATDETLAATPAHAHAVTAACPRHCCPDSQDEAVQGGGAGRHSRGADGRTGCSEAGLDQSSSESTPGVRAALLPSGAGRAAVGRDVLLTSVDSEFCHGPEADVLATEQRTSAFSGSQACGATPAQAAEAEGTAGSGALDGQAACRKAEVLLHRSDVRAQSAQQRGDETVTARLARLPRPQSAPPIRRHTSSSSGSSLDVSPIMLRVPRLGASAGGGGGFALPVPRSPPSLLRALPPSARISPAQLRHLESLRRQREQQEAEALECLPSAMRLRLEAESAAAHVAPACFKMQGCLATGAGIGECAVGAYKQQDSAQRFASSLSAGQQSGGASHRGRRPASAGGVGSPRFKRPIRRRSSQ